MAVYGVGRSTFDRDLLVTDTRVLESAFWTGLPAEIVADVRRGDTDDPGDRRPSAIALAVAQCRAVGQTLTGS